MIESFRSWLEDVGLADPNIADPGAPKIKNKKIHDKYKIPNVPTYSFERGVGMARKTVEARQVGQIDIRKKRAGVPKYTYDVTQAASTKLDPGGSPSWS